MFYLFIFSKNQHCIFDLFIVFNFDFICLCSDHYFLPSINFVFGLYFSKSLRCTVNCLFKIFLFWWMHLLLQIFLSVQLWPYSADFGMLCWHFYFFQDFLFSFNFFYYPLVIQEHAIRHIGTCFSVSIYMYTFHSYGFADVFCMV